MQRSLHFNMPLSNSSLLYFRGQVAAQFRLEKLNSLARSPWQVKEIKPERREVELEAKLFLKDYFNPLYCSRSSLEIAALELGMLQSMGAL